MKFNALLLFMFIGLSCLAQESPRSTQYIFNSYLINPAITGIDNFADAKFGYRKQ